MKLCNRLKADIRVRLFPLTSAVSGAQSIAQVVILKLFLDELQGYVS